MRSLETLFAVLQTPVAVLETLCEVLETPFAVLETLFAVLETLVAVLETLCQVLETPFMIRETLFAVLETVCVVLERLFAVRLAVLETLLLVLAVVRTRPHLPRAQRRIDPLHTSPRSLPAFGFQFKNNCLAKNGSGSKEGS